MNASGGNDRPAGKETRRGIRWLAAASTAATALVFLPILLRSPSTTQAVPPGWLIALILVAPFTAYLLSRFLGIALDLSSSFLVGLPQVPLIVLLSTAAVWLDVRRGHLIAGSGEEAMSYGIGTGAAFTMGIILLILVSAGARLGARP